MPTDSLTRPSVIPISSLTSGGIEACVIIAGCSIRLSTPPKLSAKENISVLSRNNLA